MPAPTLIASRTNPRVKQLRSTPPKGMPRGVELIELTDEVFASVVDTQTPQGIAALLVPPAWTLQDAFPPQRTPLLLIAAGLQDPGNLGTLIRSAEAFAATAVLTTPNTVSEWNQKAIRASAGSVFRVPVIAVTPAEISTLKSPAPEPGTPEPALSLSKGLASQTWEDRHRTLPDSPKPGDPGLASETWEKRHQFLRSLHLYAAIAGDPPHPNTLPLIQANLTQPCALMIGNEGAGLSEELLALADTRITIPTPGRVESLNAAIAGSLLLYEASRQRASTTYQFGEAVTSVDNLSS
jgi:TrmH family RNA methyltransferase